MSTYEDSVLVTVFAAPPASGAYEMPGMVPARQASHRTFALVPSMCSDHGPLLMPVGLHGTPPSTSMPPSPPAPPSFPPVPALDDVPAPPVPAPPVPALALLEAVEAPLEAGVLEQPAARASIGISAKAGERRDTPRVYVAVRQTRSRWYAAESS